MRRAPKYKKTEVVMMTKYNIEYTIAVPAQCGDLSLPE